jgi:hypothetical protein
MMVVTMFLVVIGVTSTRAQNAGAMAVNIPFEFAAGSKTLPAGEYYVRRNIEGARVVIQIRSIDGSRSLNLPIHAVTGTDIQPESKLVFNKYGDHYFLSQVWISGRSNGEKAARTSREVMLQRELSRRSTKPEKVAINGKLN